MAYLLPNISPRALLLSNKERFITTHPHHHHHHHQTSLITQPIAPIPISSSDLLLHPPPAQTTTPTPTPTPSLIAPPTPSQENKRHDHRDDFYVNLGLIVRTLREDLPLLFTKDLNYDIYRDDITFVDPINTFTGIKRYKMIFWALRFHGRVLFRDISMELLRIWQPSENLILIRWNLKGVPRVPWEAKGQFQGTSRYKLDRQGKIYQHKVDNLAFNFPQTLRPAASVLDLVSARPTSPNPTFSWSPVDNIHSSSSWLHLYQAVMEALDQETSLIPRECLVPCS